MHWISDDLSPYIDGGPVVVPRRLSSPHLNQVTGAEEKGKSINILHVPDMLGVISAPSSVLTDQGFLLCSNRKKLVFLQAAFSRAVFLRPTEWCQNFIF